ncbi:unnamed protein product [Brassica oleracea]
MREVVCHVLDHLREEGPQTTTRRHFSPRMFSPTLLQQVVNLTA